MFTFQADEEFEPSAGTKRWWLYTHKTEQSVASIVLPGLFQTTHFEWQLFGFLCVFLLEGVATWQCQTEGVAITAILASIFVDIALAIVAHLFESGITELRNRLVWAVPDDVGRIKRKLKKRHLWQRLFYALILASAGFKFIWFYSVYLQLDAKAVFIGTCYALGGILHITCTGYAVFTTIHEWKLRREHNRYLDSGRKNFRFKAEEIVGTLPIQCESVEASRFAKIDQVAGAVGSNSALFTRGVLLDGNLSWLIASQADIEQKRAVAVRGVEHQMSILFQEPETGTIS